MDGNYCTVADVKQMLERRPGAVADDGLLQRLTDGASGAIRNYIGYDVLSAAQTEVRDGTGTAVLVLKNRPVTAVSSVAVGSPLAGRTALVYATNYLWDSRSISLIDGSVFTRGIATVAVNYTAGYTSIPRELRTAAARLAAQRFRELDHLGQSSKSLGGETISFDMEPWPKDVYAILELFQSPTPI